MNKCITRHHKFAVLWEEKESTKENRVTERELPHAVCGQQGHATAGLAPHSVQVSTQHPPGVSSSLLVITAATFY